MATTKATTTAENQAAPVSADDVKTAQDKVGKTPPQKLVKLGDTGEAESSPGRYDPYPEGNPPDPEDAFVAAHGFKRAKE